MYLQILDPQTTSIQVLNTCEEVIEKNYSGICINQGFIPTVRKDFPIINLAVVIDYPYGASGIHQKISQMTSAVYSGANEVDVVMSYSDFKESPKKFKKATTVADFKLQRINKVLRYLRTKLD